MGLPPSVPAPRASAHARVKALRAGVAAEPEPKLRAALAFELAALTELRLEDREGALATYREARDADPQFRPALFALRRLLSGAREFDELARVLAATVNASPQPAERAAALISLGCLFEDQLGDAAAAANSFERALLADPSCLPATLMLERSLRALGRSDEADAVLQTRTAHTFDPELRSVLARELARAQAARGEIGRAIETMLSAVAVRGRRFSTLLSLADLATEHHLPATAARAFEDAATLLASHASGQQGPDADDIAGRLLAPTSAMPLAAWLYRRAGAHYSSSEEHAADAQRAYERACASQPGELVLHMEHADACQANRSLSGARTSLLALLDSANAPRAAAIHFRLAELAQLSGDPEEAQNKLRDGLALDPDSPVLRAALEDAFIDTGRLRALSTTLEERAERSTTLFEDARIAFLRSAAAADAEGDAPRALSLYRRCAERCGADAIVLRELYGAALRARDQPSIRDACERLLKCELEGPERSALWRSRYDACLATGDFAAALETLRAALDDPACESWAGHSAWVMGGLRGDYALLASAHQVLAEQATDTDRAAAHVAAAGRAFLRLEQSELALESFRRVLELSPTDAYAVASLEVLLVARNEAGEALQLLRETAAAERNQQRSELAMLHAGAAAELAGRADLAARSYEDASDTNPDSLAPLWARLRLAERSHDVTLATRSIRALATRETHVQKPGIAQLELAERLDVLGEWDESLDALAAASSGDQVGYEAAASTLLAARTPNHSRLRAQALGRLAQHTTGALRGAIEHEQVAELMHDTPPDARTILIARTEHAALGFGDELLAFMLSDDASARSRTLANLARLDPEPQARAELALHALRTQTLHGLPRADDPLVSALALLDEAPESLAAAVALGEALTDKDAAELRVTALSARLRHTPEARARGLRAELLRAYLDAERFPEALRLARELVERDRGDLSAWDGLREAARHVGDHLQLVAACDELAHHTSGVHRARLLEEAAAALHDVLDDPAGAETRLRQALGEDPGSASLFERLHDLLLEQGDLEGLVGVLRARVAISAAPEEKLELSYSLARILRALGQRPAALENLQLVLDADPLHPDALSLAAEIYASEQNWDAAVTALDALARSDVSAAQRRLAREGAADFLEHKLKDPAAAYAQLAQLASAGYADLAIFARMADVAQRAGLPEHAASSLAQAAGHSAGPARATFERRAAVVYAQSLGRADLARDALLRALAADPLDIDALEALQAAASPNEPELTSSEMFLHELWSALRAEPADPKLLRALARCARLRSDRTLEYLALTALHALALADADDRAALETLRAKLPSLPTGTISDMQFSLLGGPTHAHAAFRVARVMCRAGLELTVAKPHMGRRTRVRDTSELYSTVGRLTRTFGLKLDELHQNPADADDVKVWAKPGSGELTVVLGADLYLPLPAAARFSLGMQCAAVRLGVLPLVSAERSVSRDLLYASLCFAPAAPQPPDAARLRPLATELSRRMSRKDRRDLEAALSELPEPASALHEVGEDARAGAYRAGALLALELAPALQHVFKDGYTLATLVNSKIGLRLLRCWTSQTCLVLLRGLGMTA